MVIQVSKLTEAQWAEIRLAYEASGANVLRIARTYGISDRLIRKKAQGHGWIKGHPHPPGSEEQTQEVRYEEDELGPNDDPRTAFAKNHQAKVLTRQQRELTGFRRRLQKVYEPVEDRNWRPPELASKKRKNDKGETETVTPMVTEKARLEYAQLRVRVAKDFMATLALIHRMEREAIGVDTGKLAEAMGAAGEEVLSESKRRSLARIEAAWDRMARRTVPGPPLPIESTVAQ